MSQYKIEAGTGQYLGDRQEQQDRVALFGAAKAPGFMMAVLADGMGGLTGGAMAAEQVIRTARQFFDEFSPLTDNVDAMLQSIAAEAHTIIKLSGLSAEKEPHSTLVALVLTPSGTAHWAHAGDSRLYHYNGSTFVQRTRDHSFVERLIEQGRLKPEEGANHRLSHILVNVLGSMREEPFVTLGRYDGLKAGDAFLLCSDGLWHYFNEQEMAETIANHSPRQISERLIAQARERAAGSKADNCTLAIVKLVAP
ncbi:MAG: serine/threonine protein phosphatase PrpC [Candidatus Paceibacteria bacterium]|jgi:serine/threonine protein phosphatase PrpC